MEIISRLTKMRMRGKHINTAIIQFYATTSSNEEIKDAFYELQAELEGSLQHNLKSVICDLNAKVGNNNTNYNRAIGRGAVQL